MKTLTWRHHDEGETVLATSRQRCVCQERGAGRRADRTTSTRSERDERRRTTASSLYHETVSPGGNAGAGSSVSALAQASGHWAEVTQTGRRRPIHVMQAAEERPQLCGTLVTARLGFNLGIEAIQPI